VLDRVARRLIDPFLLPLAKAFVRARIPATAITVTGCFVGLSAAVAAAFELYSAAGVLILLNRLGDGLDGMVARQTRPTDRGGFLDIVLDMIFYGAVPLGFAVSRQENLLPAAALLHSFLGTSGSFLAWAAISAKRGHVSDWGGKKSFAWSAGLMEGTETVLFFLAFCLFPNAFVPLAWTFCGLCWLTTVLRIAISWQQFADASTGTSSSRAATITGLPQPNDSTRPID
jgi:phosphatidylglycerophosphate synthase